MAPVRAAAGTGARVDVELRVGIEPRVGIGVGERGDAGGVPPSRSYPPHSPMTTLSLFSLVVSLSVFSHVAATPPLARLSPVTAPVPLPLPVPPPVAVPVPEIVTIVVPGVVSELAFKATAEELVAVVASMVVAEAVPATVAVAAAAAAVPEVVAVALTVVPLVVAVVLGGLFMWSLGGRA